MRQGGSDRRKDGGREGRGTSVRERERGEGNEGSVRREGVEAGQEREAGAWRTGMQSNQ